MSPHSTHQIPIKEGVLALGPKPLIMGILNVTPDSFSDGGHHTNPQKALSHTRVMLEQGADIIDIGGQSTRPGAKEISTQEELDRVIPVIEHLISSGIKVPISIDTFKALVADQAIQAGATIINDVSGLQREPEIATIAARYRTPIIIMHWDKQRDQNADIIEEMHRFLEVSLGIAQNANVQKTKIIIDPGFGFAKTLDENYQVLGRLHELHKHGLPLLIGTSRKSMLSKLLQPVPDELATATAATSVIAYQQGAHIFRVHDVAQNLQALQIAYASLYAIKSQDSK
ncbi:Dihydropteroate synthase [hydrothermal vent metagenome]|uniref:dihydropteroate synthase n=1 Tax=hydrothermal vent metagenome TaxID=652676 RepID=A0A3B0UY36_9ZZZZ